MDAILEDIWGRNGWVTSCMTVQTWTHHFMKLFILLWIDHINWDMLFATQAASVQKRYQCRKGIKSCKLSNQKYLPSCVIYHSKCGLLLDQFIFLLLLIGLSLTVWPQETFGDFWCKIFKGQFFFLIPTHLTVSDHWRRRSKMIHMWNILSCLFVCCC